MGGTGGSCFTDGMERSTTRGALSMWPLNPRRLHKDDHAAYDINRTFPRSFKYANICGLANVTPQSHVSGRPNFTIEISNAFHASAVEEKVGV